MLNFVIHIQQKTTLSYHTVRTTMLVS